MADVVHSTLDEIGIVDETNRYLYVEVVLSDLAHGADAPSEAFEHLARDDEFVSAASTAEYIHHEECHRGGRGTATVLYRLPKEDA